MSTDAFLYAYRDRAQPVVRKPSIRKQMAALRCEIRTAERTIVENTCKLRDLRQEDEKLTREYGPEIER